MTIIAGFWRCKGDGDAGSLCAAMLDGSCSPREGSPEIRIFGDLAFGRSTPLLPKGPQWVPGPLAQPPGLFAFHGRIDNREEVGAWVGLTPSALKGYSDSALAAVAWEREGVNCADRLLGDFVFAAWDMQSRRLALLRAPLSMRTLHWARDPRGISFCSSIEGLLAIAEERTLDQQALLGVLAGGTYVGTAGSLFRGIEGVPQGQAILLDAAGERRVALWNPPDRPGQWRSVDDCAAALRSELDRAVGAQLRRSHGRVAAHLSGGRDSGVVAATAATLLRAEGEGLLAYTGAPGEGFAERAPAALSVDETALAERTASLHPNMQRRTCRAGVSDHVALLRELQAVHGAPLLTPSNLPWWAEINRQAEADGATILLTGQAGNWSVSAGGWVAVRDLALEGRWRDFGTASIRFDRERGTRNAAARLIGPLLPPWCFERLRKSRRLDGSEISLPLLRQPWRRQAEELRRQRLSDRRPPASYRAFLRQSLLEIDNAERMSEACYGLDVRDPTADRRLVELVLTFPATAWLGKEERPAFARAFADRLPPEVIGNPTRAYQQADWFEQFDPAGVLAAFQACARHPLVDELFDMDAVSEMVSRWPRGTRWMSSPRSFRQTEDDYRNKLLPALATALFITTAFPV